MARQILGPVIRTVAGLRNRDAPNRAECAHAHRAGMSRVKDHWER